MAMVRMCDVLCATHTHTRANFGASSAVGLDIEKSQLSRGKTSQASSAPLTPKYESDASKKVLVTMFNQCVCFTSNPPMLRLLVK